MSLKIALVAAEPSGDQLGAALMEALISRSESISFIGIGGPAMISAGLDSRYPMDKLSVMGLIEVLPHLRELLAMRKELVSWFIDEKPDIFIGIDAPDFNLGISKRLKGAGVKTVQYVSPTVWAWKQGRVKTLRETIDRVLSIFPFEESFLEKHHVPVTYVGHPMADKIPLVPDRDGAREAFCIPADQPVLALLPGSRCGEIERLSEEFLKTARQVAADLPGLVILAPMVNETVGDSFERFRQSVAPELDCRLIDGSAGRVLEAADVVLTASGTATLQALLYKKPMVVGYRLNALTYWLATTFRMIKIPYVAMANLLCGEMLAPEFIQHDCVAEKMAPAVTAFFRDRDRVNEIEARYTEIHNVMRRDAANSAADTVLEEVARRD